MKRDSKWSLLVFNLAPDLVDVVIVDPNGKHVLSLVGTLRIRSHDTLRVLNALELRAAEVLEPKSEFLLEEDFHELQRNFGTGDIHECQVEFVPLSKAN